MSWKDNLLPASFRGITFMISGDTTEYGRRNSVYEYPFRDIPYVEDLGRKARKYTLEAFIVGDDFQEQEQKLIAAIEQPDSGILIHPYYGELLVNISGVASIKHSANNGRMSVISFSFIEAGEIAVPEKEVITEVVVDSCADKIDTILAEFSEQIAYLELPDYMQKELEVFLRNALEQLDGLFYTVSPYVEQSLESLYDELSPIIGDKYATKLFNKLSEHWDKIRDTKCPLDVTVGLIKKLNKVVDLESFQLSKVWPPDSESMQVFKMQKNLLTIMLSVKTLAESSRLIANLPKQVNGAEQNKARKSAVRLDVDGIRQTEKTMSYDDLVIVKEGLNLAFDKVNESLNNDYLYIALSRLKAAINQDIDKRLLVADKIVSFVPNSVSADFVLAYELYGDAKRASDVSVRNNTLHPGFVLVESLKVPTP